MELATLTVRFLEYLLKPFEENNTKYFESTAQLIVILTEDSYWSTLEIKEILGIIFNDV